MGIGRAPGVAVARSDTSGCSSGTDVSVLVGVGVTGGKPAAEQGCRFGLEVDKRDSGDGERECTGPGARSRGRWDGLGILPIS